MSNFKKNGVYLRFGTYNKLIDDSFKNENSVLIDVDTNPYTIERTDRGGSS